MAPFPLVKLGYLAVKQISKPIANYIKRKAVTSPFVRQYLCVPPAQLYHWMEVNFRLRMMGLGRAKNVDRLPDKEAIELGGEMLGESLVFGFACIILLSEYQRSSRKDQLKEEKIVQDRIHLENKVKQLKTFTDIQESQIRDIQRKLDQLSQPPSRVNNSQKKGESGGGIVKKIFGAS